MNIRRLFFLSLSCRFRRGAGVLLLAAILLALAGCGEGAGGDDDEKPVRVKNGMETFSEISASLGDKPVNTVDAPYELKLSGFDFSVNGMFAVVCDEFGDKYVALDLSACEGLSFVSGAGEGKNKIVSIILPRTLESLPAPAGGGALGVFEGYAALKSVEISGAVSIGDSAFKNCANLETISFPPRIAGAVSGAFAGCPNLSFIVRAGRGNLSSPDGKSLVLNGNTLLAAAESAVAGGLYEVPAGIRELAADSLAGLRMTTVKIPDSVDKIGARAFAGCASLTTVEIRAVTPPALILSGAAASFPAGITAIHVPSGSLSNYRGAWTQFSTDKFYGF
ncbi:MAG: hypothetical protein Pg6C_18500 [Treponemataceae bacterium]|nr:MAG: hypothetical protein Pg6C_18500 [Treponemataceae bacterium]